MRFDELGLAPELLRAISEQSYVIPTPIQAQAIPVILDGRDLMGGSQTGTGKTAAFSLPLLQRILPLANLSSSPARHPMRILMLAPTRELALQVYESVRLYGKHTLIRVCCVFGGVDIKAQIEEIRRGVEVLVATPGRLLDLVEQKCLNFNQVQALVLDEADRMLDMGFIPDVTRIIRMLPPKRQNLLFSATFSGEIKKLADGILSSPILIEVAQRNTVSETIAHRIYPVASGTKRALLIHLLRSPEFKQTLVFTGTKLETRRLARELQRMGIAADSIHGDKTQPDRLKALEAFKNGSTSVLVATDVAARGLDIDDLPHVINYELPHTPEDYIHRIGRTGRAGRHGTAISLVSSDEFQYLTEIEKLIKRKIERVVIPGFEPESSTPPLSASEKRLSRGASRSSGKPAPRRIPAAPDKGKFDFSKPYEYTGPLPDAAPAFDDTKTPARPPKNRRPVAVLLGGLGKK